MSPRRRSQRRCSGSGCEARVASRAGFADGKAWGQRFRVRSNRWSPFPRCCSWSPAVRSSIPRRFQADSASIFLFLRQSEQTEGSAVHGHRAQRGGWDRLQRISPRDKMLGSKPKYRVLDTREPQYLILWLRPQFSTPIPPWAVHSASPESLLVSIAHPRPRVNEKKLRATAETPRFYAPTCAESLLALPPRRLGMHHARRREFDEKANIHFNDHGSVQPSETAPARAPGRRRCRRRRSLGETRSAACRQRSRASSQEGVRALTNQAAQSSSANTARSTRVDGLSRKRALRPATAISSRIARMPASMAPRVRRAARIRIRMMHF